MFARSTLLVTLLVVLPMAQPAAAGTPTRTVSYADLDLTKPVGVETLDRRVAAAVASVCAVENIRDLRAMAAARTCKNTAREAAKRQIALAVDTARNGSQVAAAEVDKDGR